MLQLGWERNLEKSLGKQRVMVLVSRVRRWIRMSCGKKGIDLLVTNFALPRSSGV
jgi:S-adenosylmethionine:tRNA-ribosyltransferase-isomerase (queuine synthetase)